MLNIFAEELKRKREEVGLSIQFIANKTRIDKKYLELMEQGNFSFLPELYVKSFIRAYASTIGIDPEETVKRYLLAKEGKLLSETENETAELLEEKVDAKDETHKATSKSFVDENVKDHRENQTSKKNGNFILIFASVAVLILAFVIYYSFDKKDEIIIEETPFEEIVSSEQNRYEESSNDISDNLSVQTDSLSLEIFSKDTTWVYLILDDSVQTEFTLYPNNRIVVKAVSSFKGTIGNSGSTILKLNDKNLDFIGRYKLPRHFRIDRNFNIEYLTTRPILENQNVR